jgi:hypothetical protein
VLVCNRATIALTGLAQLGVDRTSPLLENWIVTALTKHGVTTISGACKALKAEAVQAFNLLSVPREQRGVAFAVAGWSILEPGSEARATIACVSNAFHWGENRWDALASDQFRWEYLHLSFQQKFILTSFGQPFPREPAVWLNRILRATHGRVSYTMVMNFIAQAMLRSASSNPTIGCELNVVSLPRPADSNLMLALNGPPDLRGVRWCSWPATSPQYGPNFVCGGEGASQVQAGYF